MASIPHISYSNYPLKDIPQPHAHDVLCGRGGGTNNHIGNSHWRMLVAANKQLYVTLPKRQKMLLSRSIVNAVRSQNPPGRFLQKDSKSNLWFDVGDQRAQEKTSQALREGAPEIRNKTASTKEGEVNSTDSTTTKEKGGTVEGGKSASDNSSSPHTVCDASGAAPPSTQGDKALSASNNTTASTSSSVSAIPSSGHPKLPSQVPHSTGLMSSSESEGNGNGMHQGMPQQFFPNSASGPFLNPLQQQQNNMSMFAAGNNNAAMMQMMFQQMMMMMMNDASHNNGGSSMPMISPQHQQQWMQMMMASTAAGNGGNVHSQMSPQVSGSGSLETHQASNIEGSSHQQQQNFRQEHHGDFEPLPLPLHHDNNQHDPIPSFDEYVQAPEVLEPAGLSYGSMSVTENEMRQMESVHNDNNKQNNNDFHPVQLDGFNGVSIGDSTMMSNGTNHMMKLEGHMPSFGTAMSLNTLKTDMVEGGLMENIGTSFGSLSLDPASRDALFRTLEITASGPEIPPMFHSEQKAKGNLLDCSDTESENSEDREKLVAQKSQAWEKMKELTITKLKQQQSKESVGSEELMPPPVGVPVPTTLPQQHQQQRESQKGLIADFTNTEVAIPTTTLENNFSTLSAWSAVDDFGGAADNDDDGEIAAIAPPQALRKDDDYDDDNW
ncbi:hypothetical protein IV203_027466 [Nitzschia inconspicua]|uniref:DUF6824 domain-containing protein n=1 Tax=Nitzschia inconspicua TaxID=303405 RepID=A0A9K3LXR3_9STRA|nr:hypothetical protein IV203_027466 [Nitzschia inconspicua]